MRFDLIAADIDDLAALGGFDDAIEVFDDLDDPAIMENERVAPLQV